MSVKTNIAEGLKRIRKSKKMSTDEVGAAIGKSGKTIYAWEVGRGQPDGDELILLCQFFGVHLKDFYGEEYTDFANDAIGSLSENELELVWCYRKLSPEASNSLLTVAREMCGELYPNIGSKEWTFARDIVEGVDQPAASMRKKAGEPRPEDGERSA